MTVTTDSSRVAAVNRRRLRGFHGGRGAHGWSGLRVPLAALALVAVAAGCSSGEDDATEQPVVTTAQDLVEERCSASERLANEVRSDGCADAVFAARVEQGGSEELRKLDRSRQIVLGRTLCSISASLPADSEQRFTELMEQNAESWGVSLGAVEELTVFAQDLCPDVIGPLVDRQRNDGPYQVDLAATGTGPIEVTYTLPDGLTATETVESTFASPAFLESFIDMKVDVEASDGGPVSCSISVNGAAVSEESGEDAVGCAATAGELKAAR